MNTFLTLSFFRAMNVLTVKIVDRSDPTCVFVALIKLLHGSVGRCRYMCICSTSHTTSWKWR